MALVGVGDVILAQAGTPLQSLGASIVVAAYSAGAHQTRRASLFTLGLGVLALIELVLLTSGQTGNVDRLSAAPCTPRSVPTMPRSDRRTPPKRWRR